MNRRVAVAPPAASATRGLSMDSTRASLSRIVTLASATVMPLAVPETVSVSSSSSSLSLTGLSGNSALPAGAPAGTTILKSATGA